MNDSRTYTVRPTRVEKEEVKLRNLGGLYGRSFYNTKGEVYTLLLNGFNGLVKNTTQSRVATSSRFGDEKSDVDCRTITVRTGNRVSVVYGWWVSRVPGGPDPTDLEWSEC